MHSTYAGSVSDSIAINSDWFMSVFLVLDKLTGLSLNSHYSLGTSLLSIGLSFQKESTGNTALHPLMENISLIN